MEKRFFSFCAVAIGLMVFACSPARPVSPDTIRMQLGAEPSTLNPLFAADTYGQQVAGYVFDTLIDLDLDTLAYIPKMASRWEVSDDHKFYTFYLRPDVTWQDGKPFTVDDIIYTFQLIRAPETNAPVMKLSYQDIKSVTKIDDHTVQFEYDKVYFRALSVCGFMPILPAHILQQVKDVEHSDFARHPIGNGPFVFQKWETNKKITLVRNENYWGKKPDIRVIEYKIIPDPAVGLQILKKGLIDVFSLTAIAWTKQTSSPKFNDEFLKIAYPGRNYSYIAWNLQSDLFAEASVRRAMTLLIDREKIKDTIYFGLAKIVIGPFFPFSPQNNSQIKPLPYDIERAKVLLAEAGWHDSDSDGWLDKAGRRFSFVFLYPSSSTAGERLGTLMKEDFRRVGIDVNLERLEWAAFLERIESKNFDATTLGWSLPLENDPYQVWHSSQAEQTGSSNFISYRNPKVDALIENARVEFDQKKRDALYWQFQEILYDEQPYTFLYSQPNLLAVSKRFDNVIVHPAGIDILEWRVKK